MLQALLEKRSAGRVIIVTTTWDRITNARAMEQAEAHYGQLKNDVFKVLFGSSPQFLFIELTDVTPGSPPGPSPDH